MANGLSDRKADKQELMEITEEAYEAASQLLAAARPKKGSIFVVGCSTSEVAGERIGSFSSPELGQALFDGIYRAVKEAEVYLAAQCCEHLNRALILEEEAAEHYGYETVNVVPQPHAGGSFATCAYKNMKEPVAVEYLQADAGLDIGDTFIGMHIKPVAVPVRLSVKSVGEAHLTAVRRRPKSIGGERAVYNPDLK